MRRKRHEPLPQEGLDVPFGPPPEASIAVRSAVTNCWSMKPSLMPPLAWRNSAGNIRAECPRVGVQAVTAILWSMSIKKYSPPRGRYVHDREHRNRHDIEKSLTMFLDLYILSSISSMSCDSACVVLDAERCLRVLPKRGKRPREGWRALVQGHYHQPLRHEEGPS